MPAKFIFTVITYKDHPSEDSNYLTRAEGVYSESPYSELMSAVETIELSGGGDKPECVGSGLALALNQVVQGESGVCLSVCTANR